MPTPRTPASLDDLRAAPYNPRAIAPENRAALGYSLREFGDISGLTWNRRTGNLVSGHQRLATLREQYGDRVRLETEGRGEGTQVRVATPDGSFPVRVVDWDEAKEKAANIAANSPKLMGEFTIGLTELADQVAAERPADFAHLQIQEMMQDLELVAPAPAEPPSEFAAVDSDLETAYCCPRCRYEWSGNPRPVGEEAAAAAPDA